jgi:hypothetical protein
VFRFTVTLPDQYPLKEPSVVFVDRVVHPLVSPSGEAALFWNLQWQPSEHSLHTVLQQLRRLLGKPFFRQYLSMPQSPTLLRAASAVPNAPAVQFDESSDSKFHSVGRGASPPPSASTPTPLTAEVALNADALQCLLESPAEFLEQARQCASAHTGEQLKLLPIGADCAISFDEVAPPEEVMQQMNRFLHRGDV